MVVWQVNGFRLFISEASYSSISAIDSIYEFFMHSAIVGIIVNPYF